MLELAAKIGFELLLNIAQIIAGCILTFLLFQLFKGNTNRNRNILWRDMTMILLFSLVGMALPVGIYGVIPVIAGLYVLGFRTYIILPMMISNLIFNMLIPYTDVSFVWRTGISRVAFGLVAAVGSGIALRHFGKEEKNLLKLDNLAAIGRRPVNMTDGIHIITENIGKMGGFLIIGAAADTVFHNYIWWQILDLMFKNPHTSMIPRYFSGLNVVNPLFLITICIVFILLDFVKVSGLLVVLKRKGFILYFVYLAAWAALFGISAFI